MSLPKKVVKYHILKSPMYALAGMYSAFKQEKNLFIQLILGVAVTLLGIFFGRWISAMANFILMSIVLSLEMLNSSIEALCDLVHPQYSLKVKFIKDVAAASVLMVSLTWLIVIAYEILVIFFFKTATIAYI